LAERRHFTLRPLREMATDAQKSAELESRIGRLELLTKALQEELAIRQRREIAMQAELDHLWARMKMFSSI
jgi:hypothetical protein